MSDDELIGIEPWRRAWRDGFQSQFSDRQLRLLLKALKLDDPELVQGETISPPPLQCVEDWPVERACIVAYVGWKGDDCELVWQAEDFFGRAVSQAEQQLGGPLSANQFLNWFDDSPRCVVWQLLIEEIERELARRAAAGVSA